MSKSDRKRRSINILSLRAPGRFKFEEWSPTAVSIIITENSQTTL